MQIDMKAARSPQAPNAVALSFAFSNNSTEPIGDLHFQLAVTKVCYQFPTPLIDPPGINHQQGYESQLQPQTGRNLEPNQKYGITQNAQIWVAGDRSKKVEKVKLRWRLNYSVGGEAKVEMGDVSEFGLA